MDNLRAVFFTLNEFFIFVNKHLVWVYGLPIDTKRKSRNFLRERRFCKNLRVYYTKFYCKTCAFLVSRRGRSTPLSAAGSTTTGLPNHVLPVIFYAYKGSSLHLEYQIRWKNISDALQLFQPASWAYKHSGPCYIK